MPAHNRPVPAAAARSGAARVEAAWLHHGNGAELWLRLRHPDVDAADAPWSLVLQPPEAPGSEHRLTRRSSGSGVFHDGRVDLAEALYTLNAGRARRGRRAATQEQLSCPVPTWTARSREEPREVYAAMSRHPMLQAVARCP